MYRILASVLILILMPLAAWAQGPRVYFGMEARPLWAKSTLDLRDDQLRLHASRTLVEMSAIAVSPSLFRARYTLTTGWGNSDQILPTGPLQIGSTDFGQKSPSNPPLSKGGQGGFSQKPVNIDWRADPGHRLELVGLTRFPLRPAAIAEYHSSTLTAIGEKDGKPTEDSETFRRWLVGIGGEFVYTTPRERARAIVVGSDRYLFAEGSYQQRVGPRTAIGIGLRHWMRRLDGVRIRANVWFAGVEVAF